VIEPTQVVKGLGRMSRPTTSCSKSLNVRTKASPRCPELPVTMTLIFDSFSLWMISRSRPQPVRLISRYNISGATFAMTSRCMDSIADAQRKIVALI
jgi:hypothetical protein